MRIWRSIVAASLAAVLLGGGLAACGDDDDEATGTDSKSNAALTPVSFQDPFTGAMAAAEHMPMTAKALAGGIAQATKMDGDSESPAAELRSHLTHILTEHVYLAGIAVATAYHAGSESPEFDLAVAAVDKNSEKIADAIGSVDSSKRDSFLRSWRSHVNALVVGYAVSTVTAGAGDIKKKVVAGLTAYATEQGKFFDELSGGELPAKAVEKAFNEHIGMLAQAVDAFAAKKTNAYDKLKMAADHMPAMASTLATGVDNATKGEGDPNDDASTLRATLTDYLVDHVYLAGVGVFTAYTQGADSEAFTAAAGTIGKNTDDVVGAVGSVVKDKTLERQFRTGWEGHVTDFVTYAVGAATADQAKMDEALNNLDAYRTSVAKFFNTATADVIPVAVVEDAFKGHIESMAGTIDALKAALVKQGEQTGGDPTTQRYCAVLERLVSGVAAIPVPAPATGEEARARFAQFLTDHRRDFAELLATAEGPQRGHLETMLEGLTRASQGDTLRLENEEFWRAYRSLSEDPACPGLRTRVPPGAG